MKPIRVALVGLGNMGKNWLRTIRASQRFALVAIVDPMLAPLVGGVHGAPVVAKMYEAGTFDAAIIATPTTTHFEIVDMMLDREVPTLVEKPLASTWDNCARLAGYAKANNLTLAVGHVERFNPAISALADLLAAGRIGTPIHFSCTRVGGYPAAVTPGNDVLLDLAVHDLDILRSLLGPLDVVASAVHATVRPDVTDTAEILLRAESGASATIHANWITPTKIREYRVTGTNGVAFVDLMRQTVAIVSGTVREEMPVERVEPLALELDAFANLIEGRDASPLCSAADAAEAVRLAETALTIGTGLARAA